MRTIKEFRTNYPENMEFWGLRAIKKLLSYGGDVSMAMSPRNYGKTRGGMDLTVEALNDGQNVVWERYDKSGLGKTVQTLMDYIPNLEKRSLETGCILQEDGADAKIICLPYGLSDNIKGLDIPNIAYEIKDEFIPERYTNKTRLETEFDASMSVRKTLKRNGPMRSLYLANCISQFNPYFLAWNITPLDKGVIRRIEDTVDITVDGVRYQDRTVIVAENVAGTPAIIKRNLRSDMLSMNKNQLESYFDNEMRQEYTKIEQCPDRTVPLQPMQMLDQGYYFSYRVFNDRLFFTKVKPRFDIKTYVSTKDYIDIAKNQFRYPGLGKDFEAMFNSGRCLFDCAQTIAAFEGWLWNLRRRV